MNTLITRHEDASFALVSGSWVSRCKCGWESEDRYSTAGSALRAYLRLHSDGIKVRDHYVNYVEVTA